MRRVNRLNPLPGLKKIGQTGDTIIEVLLSVSILGLVLVVSFSSANHSLNAGTDAANRNKAVAFAKEQVELLRDAANSGDIQSYPNDGVSFCIDPATRKTMTPDSGGYCHIAGQDPFAVVIKFNTSNQAYAVTSEWQGALGIDTVTLYYQVPLGPISSLPGGSGGGPNGGGGGSGGLAPTFSYFRATPASVASGGNTTLDWLVNGASGCSPAAGPADWMGSGPYNANDSFKTGAITSDTTYTLACTSSSGGPDSQSSVTVPIASAPSVTLNPTNNSVEYYQSTTLKWTVSGATSCSATSTDASWSGSIAPNNGQQTIDHLSSGTKKYTLSCSGPGGQQSASTTVFVNNNPGFCIDSNFRNCTYFASSISDLSTQGLNDTISSVLVPPGRREILYKDANFSGACYLAASNVADMGNTSVGNDQLSSFKNATSGGC